MSGSNASVTLVVVASHEPLDCRELEPPARTGNVGTANEGLLRGFADVASLLKSDGMVTEVRPGTQHSTQDLRE